MKHWSSTRSCLIFFAGFGLVAILIQKDALGILIKPWWSSQGGGDVGHKKQIRISCVGDSITRGSPFGRPWPDQLQKLLGAGYHVMNFGNGGKYVQKSRAHVMGPIAPYWDTMQFRMATNSTPDIVTIMLGTNDARPKSLRSGEKAEKVFISDFRSMVEHFQRLATHPRVIVVLPPPLFTEGSFGLSQRLVNQKVPQLVRFASKACGLEIPVDVPAMFQKHCPGLQTSKCDWMVKDGCHPNTRGLAIIADLVRRRIVE